MYCIYTDREVPQENGNWDHVVPLSLGGRNQFVVWSDERRNSEIGSQVDGALVRDPLMAFALRNSGVSGHAPRAREVRWSRVQMNGRPMQMTFTEDEVRAWDARDRRYLDESEFAGQVLQVDLRINYFTAVRFLAKVALGGGYFVYGREFRDNVNCEHLRQLIMLNVEHARANGTFDDSGILVCDRFHPDSRGTGHGAVYRALCEGTDRSILISVPHDDAISFHVGIVGVFVGTIIVPANTAALPRSDEHDLGHVLLLAPGEFERCSFRELAQDFHRACTGVNPTTLPSAPGP